MRQTLIAHEGSQRFLCGAAAGRRGQPREQYSRARPLRRTSRVIREPPMEGAQLPRTADATARSPCDFGTNDCDICGACLSLTKEAHVFLCGAAAGRCGQPRPGRDWAHVPPGAAPVRTCVFLPWVRYAVAIALGSAGPSFGVACVGLLFCAHSSWIRFACRKMNVARVRGDVCSGDGQNNKTFGELCPHLVRGWICLRAWAFVHWRPRLFIRAQASPHAFAFAQSRTRVCNGCQNRRTFNNKSIGQCF